MVIGGECQFGGHCFDYIWSCWRRGAISGHCLGIGAYSGLNRLFSRDVIYQHPVGWVLTWAIH